MYNGSDYDFDQPVDRSGTNSMKWGAAHKFLNPVQRDARPLPMWVADMDFRTAPEIVQALHAAVEQGVFGYPAGFTRSYAEAVIGWQQRRFGWSVETDWLLTVPGIIIALKTLIQTFTRPGDSVLIQPPVYGHFHNDVILNGRHVAAAPLSYQDGRYAFDATAFEAAIRDDTKLFILSNPHNPTGNVWSEEELTSMGEICLRRGVLVVSDEIHQDFVLNPQKRHVAFASLNERLAHNSITCTSASKTFNLAGLQCANLFIPDPRKRNEVRRTIERNLYGSVNLLGMVATETAYTRCHDWADTLRDYIAANQKHFATQIGARVPKLRVIEMDSLYLAWIDCKKLGLSAAELEHFMLTQARLWLDKGPKFGVEGEGFMRINLGCRRATVDEAIDRLAAAIQ